MKEQQRIRIVKPDGTTVYLPRQNGHHAARVEIVRKPPTAAPGGSKQPASETPPAPVEISLREENVQEILTRIPSWLIRWGSTLILLLIAVALLLMGLIDYPDMVAGPARLSGGQSTQVIPLEPGSATTLLAEPGTRVIPGTPVLLRETQAEYSDVTLLRDRMDAVRLNSRDLTFSFSDLPVLYLGKLQGAYQQFAVSYARYDRTRRARTADPDATLPQFGLVVEDFLRLREAIEQWESRHVVRARIEGRVRTAGTDADPANVRIEGMAPTDFRAWVHIPDRGAGKVRPQQRALLRLAKFPTEDYGLLEGIVREIRPLQGDSAGYRVRIDLPRGNETTYGRRIELDNGLLGTAEIVTERKTVLRRIFGRLGGA